MQDENDDPADWGTYLANFREENGLSQKQLADFIGIGVYTIRRIENGEEPRVIDIKTMRAYFEKLPVADKSLPLPRHGLDATSMTLMVRVKKHHGEIRRKEGLAKNLISRIIDQSEEALDVIIDNLLRQYVRSIEQEDARHDMLLQLLEVGVNGK